jgi:hypothetical protein
MKECPNHQGAFDCTPFCALCEGNQEVPYTWAELKNQMLIAIHNLERKAN